MYEWIENSGFYCQFKIDFPGEEPEIDPERLFEFPKLTDDNIEKVLDNIRYFDVNDPKILKPTFLYLSKSKLRNDLIEEFPELIREFYKSYGRPNMRQDIIDDDFINFKIMHESGREINNRTALIAVEFNRPKFLEYIVQNYRYDSEKEKIKLTSHLDATPYYLTYKTAFYGRLECLKILFDNNILTYIPNDPDICTEAVKNGHLDCLKYLYEIGCSGDEKTCAFAAKNGHLDCLIYLHENECPWDGWTCFYASVHGHLDCLKYAHEKGCPCKETTRDRTREENKLDCLNYLIENNM
jgi:hypothetical protein